MYIYIYIYKEHIPGSEYLARTMKCLFYFVAAAVLSCRGCLACNSKEGKFVLYLSLYLSLFVQCKYFFGRIHAAEGKALFISGHWLNPCQELCPGRVLGLVEFHQINMFSYSVWNQTWLLIINIWLVDRKARKGGRVDWSHWWAALLYRQQRNQHVLNNLRDCLT